ncbi:hypothetical protein M8J76_006735 [Diaphorina citri]|nr:hypothetical protein M8J76_006735 [Diaphorina citri]
MLCMSETRLSETEMKNINLEGFSLMSCYKRDTMEGGGVAIFVRDSLLSDFEELKLKTQPCDLHFEFCAVENKKSNSVFICVYRSNNPRSNLMTFLEKLDMLLGEVHTRNIFLMGDFNINILVLSPVTAEFTGILNSFNLVPLINAHTRVTDSSATCIDNIFTNVCTDTDISRPLNLKSGLSDHHCQLVTIVLSEPPPKIKKFQSRSFTLENKARFSEKLLDENWAEVYNTHGVNNKLDAFYDKILRIFDSCFQFKTNTVKHHYHKKWITTGIKKSCKIKNQLFRLSRTTDDIVFKDYYKRYTKILRNVIREAKIYDNKKKIKDADPNQRSRVTWTVLNQYTGRSKKNNKHISELQVDGQTVSQPEDLANGLNNFLQTVAKSGEDATSQEKPSQFMPNIVSAELFNLRCTSMGEVVKTVKTLKNTKSTGWDDLPGDHSDDTINIDNLKITMVEETKFLGVTINQSLSWKPHINKLVSRLHSALFAIRSTRFNIDEASALLTYHSLFLSLVTYGIEFWGCDHDLHNILVLQKKALRIIYKLSYRTSCRTIFKSKGLHTVYGLYIFRLLLLIHKKKDDWYPVKDHRYPTRRKRDLITPKLTKHNSFFYEGKCFYNALPSALKLEDMNYFRSKVSDLLLEISPYTKEEYFSFLLTLTLFERHTILPKLLANNAEDYEKKNTIFNRVLDKLGTARRVFSDTLKDTVNCYSLIVSFYGYIHPVTKELITYKEESYERIGRVLMKTFLEYYTITGVIPSTPDQITKELLKKKKQSQKMKAMRANREFAKVEKTDRSQFCQPLSKTVLGSFDNEKTGVKLTNKPKFVSNKMRKPFRRRKKSKRLEPEQLQQADNLATEDGGASNRKLNIIDINNITLISPVK